ncbi:MAG: hypothetical protein AVDCRST_MAG25-824, partial [uncultured Rubrobacteraceae bacterium]
ESCSRTRDRREFAPDTRRRYAAGDGSSDPGGRARRGTRPDDPRDLPLRV